MNKKQSQRIHAKRRAKERYGVELNSKDLKSLVTKIQKGDAEFVRKISLTRSVFIVDGRKVVYDKLRKNIATFLSEDMK